ncbi:hypothetical protein [Vibrio fluvialis]|uniref:hypothetical protein n=1 Tax=Vibrio fluvialis TaxID=676 RepID=UPI0028F72FC8|nr:hypothetical protein [Vibrio fluvialis]
MRTLLLTSALAVTAFSANAADKITLEDFSTCMNIASTINKQLPTPEQDWSDYSGFYAGEYLKYAKKDMDFNAIVRFNKHQMEVLSHNKVLDNVDIFYAYKEGFCYQWREHVINNQ